MVGSLYAIEFLPAARRQLRRLNAPVQQRIRDRLELLQRQPRPQDVIKLAGEDDTYRIRIGDYRVVYTIEDEVLLILVVAIGHRRDIYRDL